MWRLSVSGSAVEGLLAGMLGCLELRPDHPLTATDRALLELLLAELARETSRELQLPSADSRTVLPPGAQRSPWSAPPMPLALTLRVAGQSHTVWAEVAWDDLLAHRRLASTAMGPDVKALSEAEVAVEALLSGPELTAGELLELQPGDVICLGSAEQEVLLAAGGVPVGKGRAGARQGRLAVNIGEMSNPGE